MQRSTEDGDEPGLWVVESERDETRSGREQSLPRATPARALHQQGTAIFPMTSAASSSRTPETGRQGRGAARVLDRDWPRRREAAWCSATFFLPDVDCVLDEDGAKSQNVEHAIRAILQVV
jgi:hypothetical protein